MGTQQDLDSALEKSLLDALEEIGGASVRDSVAYHLREKYAIKLDRISSNVSGLTKALSDIFGVGKALVEKKMVEKLALNLNLKDKGRRLEDVIRQARIEFET